jgi:hypothetical protein
LPSFLSAHPSVSIPALGAFQLQLTPFNSTPTFARIERPSDGGEENGGGDENGGGGRRRRMMRYETALLLTTAAPADAAPPLPRHWSPMKAPARRPR